MANLNMSKRGFVCGEKIPFGVDVDNQSGKKINVVEIKFMMV